MFKRFTNKQLLIIFGALAVIYLGSMAFGGRTERTFKRTISAFDTAAVNQVFITPAGGEKVSLTKNGPEWSVELPGGGTAPTGKDFVKRALESIALLEAKQLVSKNKKDWGEYKVDTAGTRVEVMGGGEKLVDLIIGRFEYKQTGMMSYVRNEDDEDTYLVDGFLETSFNRKPEDWRNKILIPGPNTMWTSLLYTYPGDSSFQIMKGADNNWLFPDSSAINSSEVGSFVSSLANTNGAEFINGSPAVSTPVYQLLIQTTTKPIEIKAYQDPTYSYILNSSANPASWFADPDGLIVEKIFVGKNKFIPTE